MDNRVIQVPLALLLDPYQTASAKVVWMALRLDPAAEPTALQARTGLSRHTVLSAVDRVSKYHRLPGGPRVRVPCALLAERSVGAQAKVLYGVLQAAPGFRGQGGTFTYASLCSLTQRGPNTLKRAMAELAGAGWVRLTRASRLKPVRFTLGSPELRRSLAEAAIARRRLNRAQFGGEAIMQEYLSLLIDSTLFTDNARPGFLVSPLTGERLEFDRYYPPDLAFEFQGAQHFQATAKFSQEEANTQRLRDLIKAGICLYEGIRLVIVRSEDLSLQGMTEKIGRHAPLRQLTGHEPLIDLLEDAGLSYRASVAARTGS